MQTPHHNLKSKALAGTLWSLGGSVGQQLFGFLVFAILARNLSPAEFGTVAIATILIDFLNIFGRSGLTDVLIYRKDLSEVELHTSFWLSVFLGLSAMTALWLGAGFAADLFATPDLVPIMHILAVSTFIYAIGVNPEALMRKEFQFALLTKRTMLATVTSGLVAVLLIALDFGVYALVFQRLTFSILNSGLLWLWNGYRPAFRFSFPIARRQLAAGVWLASSTFVNMAIPKTFDLIIGSVLGTAALGLYRIGARYLDLILDVSIRPLSSVALSSFSALQSDAPARNRAYLRVLQLTALLIYPAFAGAALIAPEALPFLFGPQWATSIPIAQILAFSALPLPITFHNPSILIALGKGRSILVLSLFDLTLSLLVAFTAARWGVEAVAIGYVCRNIASVPLALLLLGRSTGLRASEALRALLPSAVCTFLMVAALLGLRHSALLDALPDVLRIAALVPIGLVAYAVPVVLWPGLLADLLRFARRPKQLKGDAALS
ncbi:lipopolysaccharide biosynthesis protein [Aureimonas sp. AU40]|uniref:lipopolysaccharide biosynthesis protein n=1 Tax=Aureimonas sp. AU40 TaxID=1637747 RepID=UPI000782457F|nr:lipopolysaccharide biosynthesis protein [Aureimonas sp. AU40]